MNASVLNMTADSPEVQVAFTPEEIERFKNDDEYFRNFRHTLESDMNVRDS